MLKSGNRRNERSGKGQVSRLFVFPAVFFVCLAVTVPGQTGTDWLARSQALAQQINSGNAEQKRDALFEIRNLRAEGASRLALPALKDHDTVVRATAAASVVFLPDAEAVQAIGPLLGDKAEFVRREAAYALGEVGSNLATGPLLKLLQNEKVIEVRSAVAISLGKIGDPSAIPSLASLLTGRPTEDNEFIRRSAARSIGQIAQIIKTGQRRVVTPENFLPEKSKDVKPSTAAGLTSQFPQFGPAVRTLTAVLKNKSEADDTRREAAFALGSIGDPGSTSVLEEQVNSSDPYLAEIAKEAISRNRTQ